MMFAIGASLIESEILISSLCNAAVSISADSKTSESGPGILQVSSLEEPAPAVERLVRKRSIGSIRGHHQERC